MSFKLFDGKPIVYEGWFGRRWKDFEEVGTFATEQKAKDRALEMNRRDSRPFRYHVWDKGEGDCPPAVYPARFICEAVTHWRWRRGLEAFWQGSFGRPMRDGIADGLTPSLG
ncbi:hypothetical protein HN371_07050 [Candidatus Poribacteria bacterium]|jgi:hypothetical protein|nr:hypothetical protein [Candidatus Poribacteria bacterium]MBT5531432.1 hypothetical protein [Candidatus Poribacteria bacterium]MBT5714622.1 hypothetical protein [Candidatus Poribacteria bacterium]MBT7101406.1 hypothetical protein [Candidatus Poribacteria bacterium]MBT7805141.1 hypothetical protein [Candidatus Poribacteria bacterium]